MLGHLANGETEAQGKQTVRAQLQDQDSGLGRLSPSRVSDKRRTLGQSCLKSRCHCPACPDALETENPGWEPGWGALPRALCHLGRLSQEILQLWGLRLAPASGPWAEEGQGQGPGELCPGGRMYRNSVPCSGRARRGKWAFLSFTVCPAPAKSNNRDLPTSHT